MYLLAYLLEVANPSAIVFFLWFSSDFRDSRDRSHTGTEHTRRSLVIVVSPLKALMKDQVESFKKKGAHALCVSGQENEESTTLCLA